VGLSCPPPGASVRLLGCQWWWSVMPLSFGFRSLLYAASSLERYDKRYELAANGLLRRVLPAHREPFLSFFGVFRQFLRTESKGAQATSETFAVKLFSDQETRQMAYWAFEPLVQHLPYGVGGYLRSQPGQQTFEGLCAVALQSKDVLELVYDAFYELPLSGSRSPGLLRPHPPGALLRSSGDQCPVLL
jgi:hypothetical protein